MQLAVQEAARMNFASIFIPIDPVNPCLVLHVKRDSIVQDTVAQLTKLAVMDFKKPLKVVFAGEEALDAGGVKKEFFLLLLKEILDIKYGMFEYFSESRLIWFNQESFEDPAMYMLIGILCGLAIYNGTIIDIALPLALYRKLLKRKVTLDDLKELQPSVGRSMQKLLDYEGEDFQELFGIAFEITREVYGEVKTIELIPNGSQINVTQQNKQQFVDVYVDYIFNASVKEQFDAFNHGFHRVCGGRVLDLFQPQELQAMVVGNENYDWQELEKNTVYKNGYSADHPVIRMFWDVFHKELDVEGKKKFLLFLTGSDRIPILGMEAVKLCIQPVSASDDYLPVAHTCFNLLDLPVYSNREILRRKLLQAVEHTHGFALV
jgi:E3 ubiquitin-protein ligase HERC4